MDTPAAARPATALRGIVAFATLAVCAILVKLLLHGAEVETLHALALITLALGAYAWLLYSAASSLILSGVVLLCVAWAWAVRPTMTLGGDLVIGASLFGAVAWQQRRRSRRVLRLQQILDDLSEEQTVKEQAITLATQTRDALQKKHFRYAQLQAIAEALSNMTDLVAIGQFAVDHAFDLIGKSDVCLLFMVDKEQQELALLASRRREAVGSIRAKHGDQFDRYVLRTHRPLLVSDVRRDFRFTTALSQERAVMSVVACPLLLGQSAEGVLRLDSSQAGVYTQDDLRFLDILLDLAAAAVTNAKLFAQTQQLAMTDGLTNLTLRRPFLEQLSRELTRASRGREPVSIVMLDVDHFKSYNDTFGHMAGDLLLRSVAEVLRTAVPPGGVIARYGGEEFAILLPRLPRHQAGDVAEKIRHSVAQHVHGAGRREHGPITVSLGVAQFPEDAQAELELIRVADQRLYQAKHSGRNLVCAG